MTRLLARASARFYLRHPWQLALAIAGIGLGVAVFVGVELANDSARRAFDVSASTLRGAATHRLLPVGGELDERVYAELVRERGIELAAPALELDVIVHGRRVPLLGIDPLEEVTLRPFAGLVPAGAADIGRLIAEPGTVLLPRTLADALAIGPGDPIELGVEGGGRAHATVAGLVDPAGLDAGAEPPIVGDIATVQEISGRYGVLSRIDLALSDAAAEALGAAPPGGTALVPAGGETAAVDELTSAFRTNLAALGLLALVVGMFLIYATMSFAIVQRRATLGTLLAVGTPRRRIFGAVLLEAAVLGAAATLAGLALGHLLGIGLVELVLDTIGDLYFSAAVQPAAPSPWIYAQGALLGTAATLAAASKPALDAARVPPGAAMRRSDLERGSQRAARRGARLALPAIAAGAALIALAPRDLTAAFAGLFCVLAAGALLTPAATVWLMRAVERPAGRLLGLPGTLAVRGVTASLSRTGVATAALAVAVATVIGVGLMIGSFRTSLAAWLSTTLTADVYVTFAAPVPRDRLGLDRLAAVGGVGGISTTRVVDLPTEHGNVLLRAFAPGPRGWGLEITAGGDEALARLERGEGIAIAEPFAYRRELGPGTELTLPTADGPRAFTVVGVFRDYNTAGNSVVIADALYRERWRDDTLTGVGLDLAPGYDPEATEAAVRAALPGLDYRVRSSAGLERLSLAIFDRTFRVTEVLRVLAAIVAFLGMLSALLSIELERGREIAVLRALGFVPRQLAALVVSQTALLGAAAALAALPLGAVLAALLVHVINRRSFGWSMEFSLSAEPLLGGIAVALGAALLAGIYPAARASRTELARALREE